MIIPPAVKFIRFLHTKNMCAAEINRELCAVYGQNIKTLQSWAGEQMFTMESEEVSRPSAICSE
jgi:hypothetical protein